MDVGKMKEEKDVEGLIKALKDEETMSTRETKE